MADDICDAHPNVRSTKYLIVESKTRCDQCKAVTAVFAFALPASYESLYVDDDTPDDERYARGSANTLRTTSNLQPGR